MMKTTYLSEKRIFDLGRTKHIKKKLSSKSWIFNEGFFGEGNSTPKEGPIPKDIIL